MSIWLIINYTNQNIWQLINSVGISIWLNGNIDIIYNRLKKSKYERPLTLTYNTKEKLEKLLKDRMLYYQKANVRVNLEITSKDKMTAIIIKKINEYVNYKKWLEFRLI